MTIREGEQLAATLQITVNADTIKAQGDESSKITESSFAVLSKLAADGRWAVELTHIHDDGTMEFSIIELPQEEE